MLLTTRPFAFLPSQHNEGETAILGGGRAGRSDKKNVLVGESEEGCNFRSDPATQLFSFNPSGLSSLACKKAVIIPLTYPMELLR